MLPTFFQTQKKYLDFFFEQLDMEMAEKFLALLQNCSGTLIFSGVGKSGIIGKKLATTFLSTGTKALFLSPLDALHGDLGMVRKEDLFIFLSKSGKTSELLALVPYLRKKGAILTSWICEKNTKLEELSDMTVVFPFMQELCPHGLVPTTSPALQLIFGDILAVALMQKKNFGIQEYALNHPGGMIGKRSNKFVKDLMLEPPLAFKEETLESKLALFSDKKCGCLIIVDKQKTLCGIFTDGDLRRALQKEGSQILKKTFQELMSPSPEYVEKEHLAFFALNKMENPLKPITVLPVVENSKVIGILRMHDILQESLRG